jgi:hypothetical protein
MSVGEVFEVLRSALFVNRGRLKLVSHKVDVSAKRGNFLFEETNYKTRKFFGKIVDARLFVGKLETIANTIIERAKNLYQRVDQLAELRTGRMRTLVESTYHLKSKKANLKAVEDFKVKGEKIHLG